MKYISAFITLSVVLFVTGCKKSPELAIDYVPIFNSVNVSVSEKKIELKATFSQLITSNADNSGFELSEESGSQTTIFNLGKPLSGEMDMTIDTALRLSARFKIRAWVKVKEKMFYSAYTRFAGLGYPDPEITSLNKSYAYWGETIYINGRYFAENNSSNGISVTIDNIACRVVSLTENKIGVNMPDIEASGKVKIVLSVSGKTPQEMEIENYRPEVFSVSPQSIPINGEITIKGKFHSEYKNCIVPVQKGTSFYEYAEYSIEKYTDDEIILKRGTYMYCDSLYQIYFRLKQYDYDEYKYLNSGLNVKRSGNWVKLKNTPFTSFDKGLTYDGKGYVIQFVANASEFPLHCYNPQSDTWTKLASFPGNYRIDPVFVECNGIIYCGSGKKNQYFELMTDFWKYDPGKNIWTKCADLNFKSTDGVSIFGANIQDNVYVFSEWNNQKAKFNPVANTWTISNCNVPRLHDFSSNFLFNGDYYFFCDLYANCMYKFNLATFQFDRIDLNNMDRGGGNAFNVKGRIFSNFACYLSEIKMYDKTIIELYEYSDNISPESACQEMFVINDKPYCFFQPTGMSTIVIE